MAFVMVASPIGVFAHEAEPEHEHEVTTQSTEAEETTTTKTLAERLAERKEKLQTKLTNAQQNRLKARCKAAQGLLGSLGTRVKGVEKNRTALYDKVVEKLNGLVTRIGDQADTAELQAQIAVLEEKIAAFKTDITAYKQAISDLAEMDCVADPTAFRASLDEAKTLHAALLQTSKDIRAYINDAIKPTLQTIRAELAAAKEEETE